MNKSNKERLKNRIPYASTLRIDLHQQLDQLSVTTLIPKSKLIDQAVTLLLEKYKK